MLSTKVFGQVHRLLLSIWLVVTGEVWINSSSSVIGNSIISTMLIRLVVFKMIFAFGMRGCIHIRVILVRFHLFNLPQIWMLVSLYLMAMQVILLVLMTQFINLTAAHIAIQICPFRALSSSIRYRVR